MSNDNKTILQRIRQNKLVRKGLIAGALFGATLGTVKTCNSYQETQKEQKINKEFHDLVNDWKDLNANADTFLIDEEQKHCAAVYKISPELQKELAMELQSHEQTKNNIRSQLKETSDAADKNLYSAILRADLVDMKKALVEGANVNMWHDKSPILDIALEKVHQTGDEHYYKSALMLIRAGARAGNDGLASVEHLGNNEWKQNLHREIEKNHQPKAYSARSAQTITLQQALDSLSLSLPRDQGHILKDFARKGILMNSLKRFPIPKTYRHKYEVQSDISEKRCKKLSIFPRGLREDGTNGFWIAGGGYGATPLEKPWEPLYLIKLGGKTNTNPATVQMEQYIQQMQTQKETAKHILSAIGKEKLVAPLQKVEIKRLDENSEFKNRFYKSYKEEQNSERAFPLATR